MSKTVFLAGASGVLGIPLSKLLVNAGYTVYGTTRSQEKAKKLEALGVKPVIVDAFDPEGLEKAMVEIKPEIVLHQLTDLPDGLKAEEMEAALVRNARMRDEGTRNLVRAAEKAGVKKMVAQSIGFVYAPSDKAHTEESPLLDFNEPAYGETAKAVHSLEQQVLNGRFIGIVLRNGWFYGNDSGIAEPVDFAPTLHVDAAAQAVLLAMDCETDEVFNVADEDLRLDTSKFRQAFPTWKADFRL
ncbi:nucleoside-diphosphate-sugar epimerase [Pasteurella langaaensis DSM 22999]|uniref:Nucleoside-diphosphate-sugar epimerase n=1 Tax=Alitibacter langaaensis DSM 22999 TaxID=1122935 RepID=A0A2U0SK25_9PAST|nr:NAD(P)-dependent oxidoreductase [Pasteurella langaaensis]PVX31706.1 nucleoside-diphosphate-sugar epimerase [Pasteurella langaaensis DSM 22999]